MTLSELCLRRPVLAIVFSLLIIAGGLFALTSVSVRELPDVDEAQVTVSVNYTGAAPQVVDAEITTEIEGAISGIAGVEAIDSESERGSNRTVIQFDQSRDIDAAANDVRAAVEQITPNLPAAAEEPEVEKSDSQSEPIIRLLMTSDRMNATELTDYADRYVVDQLATINGVASVNIFGERAYAMRIWLDRNAMAARNVTADQILTALEGSNVELPAGQLESPSRVFQVRTTTRFEAVDDFQDMVIDERDGTQILLRDVADVEVGVENDDSLFRANGETAVGLGIIRQSRSNTVSISEAVRAELGAIRDDLPEGTTIEIGSDEATFIRNSIIEVIKTLAISVVLVIAVILVFLASPRATLIPAVTIPIALIGACAGIAVAGFSINILTLFALILAIGLVVDDAIVVLENVQRRIEKGETPLVASALGARQVTFAVLATTATLISVFVPLSFLQGEVGRLFREFGLVLAIAVGFSTFVALSLTPVMTAAILPPTPPDGFFFRLVEGTMRRTNSAYRALLTRAVKVPALILAIAAFLSTSAYVLYQEVPSELTPQEDRGVFFISINATQGANLSYTDAAVREVEEMLQPYRENGPVTDIIALVGRYGEYRRAFVVAVMEDWSEREIGPTDIIAEIQPQLGQLTRVQARAVAPRGLGVRGGGSPLEFVVSAPSFEQAAEWSGEMERRMLENENLRNVDRDYEVNQPGYTVSVNRRLARDLGIDAAVISQAMQTLIASSETTEYSDRGRQYPVIVQAREENRNNPADLRNISLRTESGELVPLDGLIEVEQEASLRAFNRYNRLPSVALSAGLTEGYDLGAAIAFIEEASDELPQGATIAFQGQALDFQETSSGVAVVFGLALLIVFLVLAAQFESFILPIVIMLSVPLAATGALLTLFLTGQALNIYSQVGLVLLIGLMAKNGILIVEFANQMRDEGASVREAAIEGAIVRLRPVLMTVVSTILGAVPLVASSGAGAESRFAIGIVIIGGFAFASVLTLFLTPVLYNLLAPLTRPRAAVAKELEAELSGDTADAKG